jgi:hypothetical protein
MVHRGRTVRLITLLSCAALPACAATESPVEPPSAAQGGVEGIYMGLRVNADGNQYPDYYTFMPDGRAFRWVPQEGLGRALDWTDVCRGGECGTYTVAGNRVTFRREPSGSDQVFEKDAQGVLRKPGSIQGYRRMHILDDVRLNGTYGRIAFGDTVFALTLRPDGHFRERGLLTYIAWNSGQSGRPTKGSGSYAVAKGTLSLTYEGGPVVHLLLVVPPGTSPSGTPPTVQSGTRSWIACRRLSLQACLRGDLPLPIATDSRTRGAPHEATRPGSRPSLRPGKPTSPRRHVPPPVATTGKPPNDQVQLRAVGERGAPLARVPAAALPYPGVPDSGNATSAISAREARGPPRRARGSSATRPP